MKKGLNFGFALIVVIAMLFTGIVAADTTIVATLTAPAGTYSAQTGTTTASSGVYSAPAGTTAAPAGTYSAPTGTTTAPARTSSAAAGVYSYPAESVSNWRSTNSRGTQAANTAGIASVAITGVTPMNHWDIDRDASNPHASVAIAGVTPINRENVQLLNFGSSTVNLAGYTLTTQEGARFTLPNAILAPGDEVSVVFQDNSAGYSGSSYVNSASRDALNDDSGYVTLSNDDGYRIASLSYDTPIVTQSTSEYYVPTAAPGSTPS